MSTKIEWADLTINPVVGCFKCSPGCDNCYAERFAARLAKNPATASKYAGVVDAKGRWTGKMGFASDGCFAGLYNSRRAKRVFVGSMGDLFHENVPQTEILSIINTMSLMPKHSFILLTKRPGNAQAMLDGVLGIEGYEHIILGVTVCNQEEADAKIPILLSIPAAKRFVSVEPMLGSVEVGQYLYGSYECDCGTRLPCTAIPEKRCKKSGFTGPDDNDTWGHGDHAVCPECSQDGCCGEIEEVCPVCGTYIANDYPDTQYIDWVICGGETGTRARPMHPDWVRSLRDQCNEAQTPFFFKGWGEWYWDVDSQAYYPEPEDFTWRDANGVPTTVYRIGKRRSGRLLDGVEHNAFPEVSHA